MAYDFFAQGFRVGSARIFMLVPLAGHLDMVGSLLEAKEIISAVFGAKVVC